MASQDEPTQETPHSRMAKHYLPEVPQESLTPEVKTFFKEYSNIAEDRLEQHIKILRDKAWWTFPYVCIGRFMFLEMAVASAPEYAEVLRRVKQGEKYLDVGCFLGQDIRKLIYDGADSENLIGTDLEPAFFDLGYELFKDRATIKTPFIACDMLDANRSELQSLEGSISIVHASAVFHLFDYDKQVAFGVRCVNLLKKHPGSMIFGRQAGSVVAEERDHPRGNGRVYRHNGESWRRMWHDDIGQKTGTKWAVTVDAADMASADGAWEGVTQMRYACRML